ncbi:MAG: biotin--[acetyl-CoA-carboxylase] ligase [Candidatus Cryptobacteroides sp.]
MNEELTAEWLEEVDSTNNEILRRENELDNLSVVAAVRQTAGRGQRNNSWLTEPGANLTFSMLVRFGRDGIPALKASSQFSISEAASLAVVEYLEGEGIQASVKWPNDIYVRGKKICGMLIENSLSGNEVSRSIVGIGLNVNQRGFPPQLANPTSMSLLNGREYELCRELPKLCRMFIRRLHLAGAQQHSEYVGRIYRLGVFEEYVDTSTALHFIGKIRDVSPSGMLLVESKEGKLKEFAFKEISYII